MIKIKNTDQIIIKTQQSDKKWSLVHECPKWSCHFVALIRCRDDRFLELGSSGVMGGKNKELLFLMKEKKMIGVATQYFDH
jgi:hypothetical protein